MADEREHIHAGGPEAPPPGEPIHLPDPSYLPVVTAAGLMAIVTGIVITWVLVVIGAIVVVVAIVRWVRETREDIAQLPLEHH